MWARVHKLDRVRALPTGGALILLEDERTPAQMQRVLSLSTLIAIARVLAARRVLEAKFDGKGEIRYVTAATLPSSLSEAITKAGAAIADRNGDRILIPAQPAGVAALIDVAFSELAHHTRGNIGIVDVGTALDRLEQRRRASPLDRDKEPQLYWPAVFELAALAGEQSRSRGGRWIDTRDMPVPFAIKFADGAIAHPTVVAQRIVEGAAAVEGGTEAEMLATDKAAATAPAPAATPSPAPAAAPAPAPAPVAEPADEPAADEPVTDEPVADEPVTDEPADTDDKPADG